MGVFGSQKPRTIRSVGCQPLRPRLELPMTDFEKNFQAFQLMPETIQALKKLSEVHDAFPRDQSVLVETVLIEDGQRQIIKSESLDAKLV